MYSAAARCPPATCFPWVGSSSKAVSSKERVNKAIWGICVHVCVSQASFADWMASRPELRRCVLVGVLEGWGVTQG